MVKRTARIVAPAEFELPGSFGREIGRIMVRWAYFENVVRHIAWDIIGVDDQTGRVAIRDPRLDERFELILDAAYLRKVSIDKEQIAELKKKALEVSRWRDLLAHGIWIPHDGRWLLQMVTGQYPKNYEAEHRKRRVHPEGINVDIDGLRNVTAALEYLIDEASNLRADVQAKLAPSPGND